MKHCEIDFISTPIHPELKSKDFESNNEFKLDVWLPDANIKTKGVLIMINGFLESSGSIFSNRLAKGIFKRYENIAKESTSKGYSVVLMPLPFHFKRSGNHNEEVSLPIQRLKLDGKLIYYGGYDQCVEDIKLLIKKIKDSPNKFVPDAVPDENFEYHLLGYSMGGAVAMGVVYDLAKNSNSFNFDSVSIIMSNWNLMSISEESINNNRYFIKNGLTSEVWSKIKSELFEAKESEIFPPVFNWLIFGEWNKKMEEVLSSIKSRILFVNGVSDDVFDIDDVLERNTDIAHYQNDTSSKNITTILGPYGHDYRDFEKTIAGYVSLFISSN